MRESRKEWMQLFEQAATEQDPEQLMTLVERISVLLEAREQRLRDTGPSIQPPAEVFKGIWPAPATDLASGTTGGTPAYGVVLHN